ncbi:MAG: hypothetical protein E7521_02550 [Ruminococcaceae bacterium]|nr:hypothetical protein [Oscillospiraceae bacterium]
MTIEEKKQLLRKYGQIDDRIEQLRRAKENSRLCDKYHSTEFEEKIKGSKSKGSIVEVTVEKREEDWDKLIRKELEIFCDLRIRIERAISLLEDMTQQRLLRLLYLGEIDEYGDRTRFSFTEISQMLCYSERQIYRIYKKALTNLKDF